MATQQPSTPLCVGDTVVVKSYGRATVISAVQTDAKQPFHNRVQVQYPDGKTYWARPSILRQITLQSKRIIAAETTKQYREAAMSYVAPDDVCLEVGCHEGVTTAMIQQHCRMIVGVDISQKTVDMAKAKFPHVNFQTIDGFRIEALRALSPNGLFDKILVDIGGIAELPTVMQMVGLYYKTWPKSVIIVKSVFFARLIEDTGVYTPSAACLSAAAKGAAAERQRIREMAAHSDKPSSDHS